MADYKSAVEDVLARAAALEEQLNALQKVIESYSEALASVRIAKQINEELRRGVQGAIAVSGDKKANVLLRATISNELPIVHLGLNIYAEADYDYASRVIEAKEKILTSQLDKLKQEYAERLKEYKKLEEVIYSLSQRPR